MSLTECYANRVEQRNRQGVASATPCRISNSATGQSNIWNCRFFFVSAETLVSKNRTIDRQKKVIISFIIGCSIGLFVLGYVFIEPLRDSIEQLAIGTLLAVLGIFNLKGDIASIHWYNRRKVTKENQKTYCLCMGMEP